MTAARSRIPSLPAVLVLVASWLVLAYGLFAGRYDDDPVKDLEAGGRFGVTLAVYLPFLVLSSLLVLVLVVVLSAPAAGTLVTAVAAAVAALFALHVGRTDELARVRPDLPEVVAVAVVGLLLSVLLGVAAHVLRPRTEPA